MIRVAVRLQRTGLIAITLAGALDIFVQAAAFTSAAGTTAAARAAFGQQMELLGRSFTYIAPLPVHLETLGGWLLWKGYSFVIMLFAFWALMSAAGSMRGDEDRGLVEQWLGAGLGRLRYVTVRFLVFAAAAGIAVTLTQAAAAVGAATQGVPLDAAGLAGLGFTLLAFTLCCYGIAMVVAQLTPARGTAAGVGGGLLVVMFFANSLSRSVDSLQPLARVISPFYYMDRTTSIVPGGTFDLAGSIGLLTVAIALAGLAAWLMMRRDVGSALVRLRPRTGRFVDVPSANPLLRIPVLSALYMQRLGLAGWALGALLGAAFVASFGKTMVDDLVKGQGAVGRGYLASIGHGDPYVGVTGYFWFGIFLLVLAIYAITQVSRWASEDQEGRLETILSAPLSRSRVVLERAVTFLVASAVVVGASSLAFYFVAHSSGIDVHAGDLFNASWPLLPFTLSFAAVGALLATRVPRATAGVLGTLAFLGYVITLGGPFLKLPDWALKLSVFSLYGDPITNGVYWDGFWILAAVTMVGFGLGALLMNRREVGA